jgi:succinate dehydrogenase / fumarate reductase flavoprotein subunit
MYHQFKELADVDITAEPMEVGPTCHYVMGGIEVDPDSAAAVGVPGLFAAGEVAGGMHGSNRLGGNSLSDLLVFGKRAGAGAAGYVAGLGGPRSACAEADVERAMAVALSPFRAEPGENPYTVQLDLQQMMNDLVGIIRRGPELEEAVGRLEAMRDRVAAVSVEGHRQYNPGWHLALDLRNMLAVSDAVARAALARTESRGGHTREDFPGMDPQWRRVNLVCRLADDGQTVDVGRQPVPEIPAELLDLFEPAELAKYFTDEELAARAPGVPAAAGEQGGAS